MPIDPTPGPDDRTLTRVGDADETSLETAAGSSVVAAGKTVGPYRLRERIGEGGMGEVWSADQVEPVRRRVALKLIKLGMDSDQVVARFEAERQALAMMSHPAIARVFDAGTTPDGRPYFAMEYIEGVSITEYCDRHRMTTRERLELFCRVCEGVQHAHQKTIIHRDIKPSNILVATKDGKPEPKIIDFGVAKATAHQLGKRNVYTELGAMIGTPEYMSPEQAEMSSRGVDTRTDVYSLGVLVYELLTGMRPFDMRELRRAGFDEMRRQIREVEPASPSSRLKTMGEATTESALKRRSQPGTLTRLIQGDLDWITMKALEKEPVLRYGSPSDLAQDVERYLRNEPVLAGPPSGLYRARKFARRHRFGVIVAAMSLLALMLFAATTTLQARRLAAERDRAAREFEISSQTSRFLVELFDGSEPGRARSITARELLDRGAGVIEGGIAEPTVRSRVMHAIGQVYGRLGLYAEAAELQEQALELRRGELGEASLETLRSMNDLGLLYLDQARYDESESLIGAALAGREAALGKRHPDTLSTRRALARLYWSQGRYDEAEPLFAGVLDDRRELLGDVHPDTLESTEDAATMHRLLGRYDAAEPLFADVIAERRRRLGGDHPATLATMASLADFYGELSRYEEAEALLNDVMDGRRRVLGEDHPHTLASLAALGALNRKQDRFRSADRLHGEALERRLRVLGDEHPATLQSRVDRADVFQAQGRLADAMKLLEQVRATATDVLGATHPLTLDWSVSLASAMFGRGFEEQALELVREVLAVEQELLGRRHPYTLHAMSELAEILIDRYLVDDEAEKLLLELIEIQARTLGEENYQTLLSQHQLGRWYWKKGETMEANARFEFAAGGLGRLFGKDHRDRLWVLVSMARNMKRFDRAGAEALLEDVLDRQRRLLGETHPDTLMTRRDLGILYQQTDRMEEAERIHLDIAAVTGAMGDDRPGWAPQDAYYQAACGASLSGDADRAFEYLELALASDEHGQFPYWIRVDSDMIPIREDPRWPVFLEDVGRHRQLKNGGMDPAALQILRTSAHWYRRAQPRRGLAIAMEILRVRTDHQGEDHWETVSARNDAAIVAWEAEDFERVEELIGRLETLEPLAPEAVAEAKSAKDRTFRSGIVLINETDRDLDVYWVNETGRPLRRGTVAAHDSQARSSAPNQAWKLGDAVFVTKKTPATAVVRD